MFLLQFWDWVDSRKTSQKKKRKPKGFYQLLCVQICSQAQNFAKLVQESWLILSNLTKAIQKHYINTFIPAEGENAAYGCMARSCYVSADRCNFPSLDLYFAPSWKTADHLAPTGKVCCGLLSSHCWETVHRAISSEQWMCYWPCLCIVLVAV